MEEPQATEQQENINEQYAQEQQVFVVNRTSVESSDVQPIAAYPAENLAAEHVERAKSAASQQLKPNPFDPEVDDQQEQLERSYHYVAIPLCTELPECD
jgi:primosomal protein N''